MSKAIYIVIVTYNAMPWIRKCLESIKGYNIVVVDNNSSDETISFIRFNFPTIEIFEQPLNLGFGQANNIGIRYALDKEAEHVFLLNQDAYIIDDALDKLIALQSTHSEYGILSPIHVDSTQNKLDFNFSTYVTPYVNPNFYSDYVLNKKKESIYEVSFINAAGWLISKQCLITVGGFDPLFFHYGEDDNFCQRVIYHNFKIGVVPDCFMIHDREDRKKIVVAPNSKRAYQILERKFKVKYANINVNDAVLQMNNEIKHLKKTLFKLFMKAKFKSFNNLRNNVKLYKQIAPQIYESRALNKKKGTTHL